MRISDWSSDVCSSDLAGTGAAQPVRLRRPWRAIYTGFALAAPDGRAAGHVAPQGGARRAEGGTGEARRALCAVRGGEHASPIPPHREMGRGSSRRLVEGNGARPPNFPSTTRCASVEESHVPLFDPPPAARGED